MKDRHKTSAEWREVLRGRLSPRLANQELFDMLWEDMPHIFAEVESAEKALEAVAALAKRFRRREANAMKADLQTGYQIFIVSVRDVAEQLEEILDGKGE